MKIHVGVDRGTKLAHSLVTTPANVNENRMVRDLLHGGEKAVWGDTSYMGQGKVLKEKAPEAIDLTQKKATRNRKLTEEEIARNKELSKTRVKVEHIFVVAKNIFGYRKVRNKGLAKNTNFIHVLFALSNLYMVRRCLLLLPAGA